MAKITSRIKRKAAKRTVIKVTKKKGLMSSLLNFFGNLKAHHSNTMGSSWKNFKLIHLGIFFVFFLGAIMGLVTGVLINKFNQNVSISSVTEKEKIQWMELNRDKNVEYLYIGTPGDKSKSTILKEFKVKTGIPGQRPTPLSKPLGKSYWKIIKKYSSDNPETAPYFLELDIPVEDGFFGPVPYKECNGQCSWELPGYFGLHGVNGDMTRLGSDNPGSSGCIRHSDEDITYLYKTLNVDEGVRYYIN